MCGILTILTKNQETSETLDKIKKGFEVLKQRGPDNHTFKTSLNYIYGFTRLSINDKTDKGNQPFIIDNTIMFCNGEIYNHKELEKEFNLKCVSNSDCECIIKLYKLIGFYNTIIRLNGDFAIVIIDGDNLYYARDRIGVRPLFFGVTPSKNIALASTARVICDYCVDIINIQPGVYKYNNKEQKISFVEYKFPMYKIVEKNPFVKIREYLTKSVKIRLMSDRNICCMLSGGLDSSLIASILCKIIGPENVRTYSIGIKGSEDLRCAKIVSEYLGTKHTEVNFTPEEGISVIPEVIKCLESYDITTIRASVGMWLLSKYIKENTQDVVIISGEGSDELLMGYLYFHHYPTEIEADNESIRLIKELYKYDVLRADRCISSHGLEVRVPFLDKNFIDLCISLPPYMKVPVENVEKYILRKSFENDFLPNEILWRRKDGFSDGCSGIKKKWYQEIQDYVDTVISDDEFNKHSLFFTNKEAYYYKKIYNNIFPKYQPQYDYWLPKWIDHAGEPSGREISIYNNVIDIKNVKI